jgi:hypothetical protein
MTINPKWLEILKASGWQTAAGASACALFLLVAHWGWLPPLEPWMVQLAAFALLLLGFLTLASFISSALKVFPASAWFVHWVTIRREKKAAREYIPHMTPKEREIIGFLLAKNQKMLTVDSDGGHAVTLISRKIIVRGLQPGQVFHMTDMPMYVPDHVWDVLAAHKDQFPYHPPARGERETHPWRVPWMAR